MGAGVGRAVEGFFVGARVGDFFGAREGDLVGVREGEGLFFFEAVADVAKALEEMLFDRARANNTKIMKLKAMTSLVNKEKQV